MSQRVKACHALGIAGAVLGTLSVVATASAAPTDGWKQTSFTYKIQSPYNLAASARFKITGGVTYTWVFSTDKAFESGNGTLPRTEMRWNNNYTSGRKMFDSDLYVPSGTSNVSLMQIFGANQPGAASALQLRVYSGRITRYQQQTIRSNAYNVWWNLKVAHDANANTIRIYDNDALKLTVADRGNATHYFKNGVYAQSGMSSRMESRWRNIKYWTR